MKYLVIANNFHGYWNATIYIGTTTSEREYMIALDTATSALPMITADNYQTVDFGKMTADNIEDIEPAMRKIGFRKCDVCGAWITPQDIRTGASTWDGSMRKCPICVANEGLKTMSLNPYHSTNRYTRVINGEGENYNLDNVKGWGYEWEFYNGDTSDIIRCNPWFYARANDITSDKCMFRCERDGTVSGEIISNVFTKKALYAFDFENITRVLKENGNIEGNTHAGMHAHGSKLWLGDTPKEQVLNFLKLQYFMKSYQNDFLKLCGRDPDEMYYCQFFSHSEIEEMRRNIERYGDDAWYYMPSDHGGGDGCALNASGSTIEYRIGLETNDPERMKHYALFLQGIVENIKNVPFSKCYCLRKVTKLVPQETMQYWRKQGCFLNTNAINERGVSISC